jgi:hypothetical protein
MDEACINDRILQHRPIHAVLVKSDLAARVLNILQVPARTLLIEGNLRSIIAFVEVFEDGGEDLWLFVGQLDAFARCLEELCTALLCEVGGLAQNVFVRGEETL